MRITYLHQYYCTPRDSGGTRTYEMARHLAECGHAVNMITSIRDASAQGGWQVSYEDGITVHRIPVPYSNKMSYQNRIKAFVRFAWKSAVRAAALDTDVVLAVSTPLTIALPAVFAARRRKVPMVFEVGDLWPELPIAIGALKGKAPIFAATQLERFAYRNSAAIIALSPGMKDGVVKQGYPAAQVHVIPNMSDIERFQVPVEAGMAFRRRFDWLANRPLVLYAGTLGWINGVGFLARVAARAALLDPEVRFLVVGDGVERAKIEAEARQLGVLDHNFFMLQQLPKSEMPALFSAATLSSSYFIDLPEMWANSANKFFDALAAGRPVVINYQGWQADLLRETNAGIVVPPNDADVAASTLIERVRDQEWLRSASVAALGLARAHFDRNLLVEQLHQVLTTVVGAAKSGAPIGFV